MTAPVDAATTVAAAPSRARLTWVDAARGYSVAAVVLFHVVLWHYSGTDGLDPLGARAWGAVNSALGSVRMPVLLAVSGLVLSRQVREGLHRSTTGFRAASSYYLYVVWLVVYAAFSLVVTRPYLRHPVEGVDVLVQLVVPGTTLWYVFGLALFVVALSALHRVPPWAVLAVLVVVSTVMHGMRVPGAMWIKVPEVVVFFAIGVYGAPRLRALAERATVWRLLVAFGAACVATLVGRLATGKVADALLFVPRSVAFLVLAVLAVAIGVRWSPVRRLGVALGRRTLAAYVLHPLLIALVTVLALGPLRGPHEALLGTAAGALAYPLVLTVVVVAASLGIQSLAERARLGFLFEMPPALRARFGRA